MNAVTHWIETNPTLFAVVIWPAVSALVLGAFKPRTPAEYAAMNPRIAGVLMALSGLGFDPRKALEGLSRALTGRSIPLEQAQVDALIKRSSVRPPPDLPVIRDTPTDPEVPIHVEEPPPTKPTGLGGRGASRMREVVCLLAAAIFVAVVSALALGCSADKAEMRAQSAGYAAELLACNVGVGKGDTEAAKEAEECQAAVSYRYRVTHRMRLDGGAP